MKNGFCLILMLFLPLGIFAQKQGQERIDSLKTELSKVKEDSHKANVFNNLSREYYTSGSRDTAFSYAQQALKLSERLNFKKGTATASRYFGNHYSDLSDTINAFEYYRRALNTSKEIDDKQGMMYNLRNIGILYAKIPDFSNAMENYQQALDLAKKNQNYELAITIYRDIGGLAINSSNLPLALENYQQALALAKKNPNYELTITIYRDIGWVATSSSNFPLALENYQQALALAKKNQNYELAITIYRSIGNMAKRYSNYPLALENFQQALRISEKTGDKQSTASLQADIGWFYRDLEDVDKALDFLNKSLENYVQLENERGASFVLSMIGNIYMGIAEYKKSLEYYNRSSDIKKEINNELGLASDYANVAFLYQLMSDYAKALKYHKLSFAISNTLDSKSGKLLYYKDMGNLIQFAPDSILLSIDINPVHRYKTAIDYENRALKLAKEVNDPMQKGNVLNFLITAYEKQGDFKSAYYNLQNFYALGDSIQGQSVREEILRKEMQHDFEKKADVAKAEQEKKDIRQRNIRNSSFATVGILLFFSLVVLRQRNKVKKEKKRSDTLLLNILPEEIADELKEKGSTEAKQFDEVSILFTDFVQFTQTSENLKPQELVKELNECFTAFDNIMEKYGLEKIKTIGDAYMAVCGLPAPDPDHAKKTVQAALEIRDFIEQRRQAPLSFGEGLGVRSFEIRIGIHSGSVVAGIVGVKKFAYDIWGDTVNTAARMEQSGTPGKVNISETTYELIKEEFNCTYRGKIDAKGKGEVDMYFVNN